MSLDLQEGAETSLESWRGRGSAPARAATPRNTRGPTSSPGSRARGDSPPPASPRPTPCCRTRRWQARWCSCPRTSPPPSCQPEAGPTSEGRPWPLRSIGPAARVTEKRPVLQLEGNCAGRLYAAPASGRMWRLPRPPSRARPRPRPAPPLWERFGHAHTGSTWEEGREGLSGEDRFISRFFRRERSPWFCPHSPPCTSK